MSGTPTTSVEHISIRCADEIELTGTLYRPAGEPVGAILVCSALGVPRGFYGDFAGWLAGQGYAALTFDYRGTGDSPAPVLAGRDIQLADWGRLDMDAAIAAVLGRFPGRPVFQVGHSCGGQLLGLAAQAENLAGAVLVAATAPNGKRYPAPARFQLFLVWHVLIPVLCAGRDIFPARRLGMSAIDAPAGVMAQWARWARSSDYLFTPEHGLDTARYARLAFPILSLGFDDDGYASPQAIDALLGHYAGSPIEKRQIEVGALQVGRLEHFGFFREKARDTLWQATLEWLERTRSRQLAA